MATTSRFVAKNGLDNNSKTLLNIGSSGSELSFSGGHPVTFTSTGTTALTLPTTGTLATLSDIKDGTLTLAVSGSGLSGSASFSANTTSSVTFTVTSNATSSNTNSTIVFRDSSGNFSAGTITATLNGTATNVSGIVAIANGGTGASTATTAITNLGATTTGSNLFTLANPGATTFVRINANNTISALGSSDFRTAIGAGTGDGTVTNVSLSLPNIFNLTTSSVSTSGTLTATLASQNANYVFAGPTTGSATTPTFRLLVASDIPSLNYAPLTSGTSILYGNGSGGFSNVNVGTGLSFSGGTLSNSAPDQTVTLNASTNVTITGTYPTFTISATDTNTTYTNGTGLNLAGTTFSINTSTVATLADSQTLTNKTIGTSGLIFAGTSSGTSLIIASSTPSSNTLTFPTSTGTLAITTDIKDASLTLAVSGVGLTGSASFSANASTSATFTVASNATSANTVNTIVSRDASGNFSAGTITANLSGNATNVTGIVAIANGGTNATTAAAALTNLGATTVGANLFKLTDPNSTSFITINSANTVSARSASEFRSDLGATTVGSALFTLSNPGSTSFIRINADNTVTAQSASNFRADLGANTVGSNIFTLSNPGATTFIRINSDNTVTARSASDFRTDLGASALGDALFTLSTTAIRYIQISTTSVNLLTGAAFRTAIGAGTGNGTVTSVDLSMPNVFTVSNNPVTTSGTLTVTLANQNANTVFAGPSTGSAAAPTFRSLTFTDISGDALTVSKGGTGTSSLTSNAVLVGTGTSAVTLTATSSQYKVFVSGSGGTPTWGAVSLDQSGAISGKLPIANGGTNATTAAEALTNLGALSNATNSTQDGYFSRIYLLESDTTPTRQYLQIINFDNLSASRILSISTNDADRTLTIAANATISGTNTGDQTITLTGDVTGSGTSSFTATLSTSGVTAGTFNNSTTSITPFTVDSKGRITNTGTPVTITPAFSSVTSKPTTLSGYGITDALSNSTSSTQSGYFGHIYLYDTTNPSNYLQISNIADLSTTRTLSVNTGDANRTITLSGDTTLSGTNTGDQTITLTGDVTGSGTSSFAATLSTSGVTAGTYNNSTTAITPFTVDSKGRITSTGVASTISPAFSSITGTPTTLSGYGITDALSNSTSSTQNAYFGDIHLRDDTSPSHYLKITDAENLTADRTLNLNVNDANRTISLSGNLTVSATSTLSGTNTGDQTITLTGDVTGSGTSSFAATISNNAVTFAKIVNASSSGLSVVGRDTNSAGNFGEINAALDHQILRRSGSSIGFGTINLATSAAVGTSILPVGNGGTGVSSFVTSRLLVSNSSSTTGVIETSSNITHSTSNLTFSPFGTSSGNTFELRFAELSGTEYVALKAADSMTTSYTYVLPSSAPTNGQVLSASSPSAGIVTLSWANDASGSGSGTVSAGDQFKLAYYRDTNGSTVVDDATQLTYSTSGPHLLITSAATTATPLVLKGIASQSDPLMKITNSSDTSLVTVSSTGILTLSNSTAAANVTSGALVITGGLGVGSTSYLATTNISTLSLTNALAVSSGGIGTTSVTANYVFAGPTTGSAAAPSFRALVANDIPSLSSLYAPVTSGTSILYGNGSGGFSSVTIGSNLTFSAGTLSAIDTNTTYTNGTGITLTGTSFSINTTVVATLTDAQTLSNKTIGTGGLIFSGTTSGTTLIKASSTPSSNTLTLPTSTDTIAVTGDIKDASLTLAVSGVGLTGSATFSANASTSATFTVTSNATSANTVSTVVSRDASGNFSAGTITSSGLVLGSATGALSASSGTVSVGTLTVGNGGTGVTTIAAGRIVYGNNTGAVATDSRFTWSGTNQTLTLDSTSTTTSNLSITKNNITTNSYLGVQIANNSSATVSVTAQHSPSLDFIGHVWNTTPTAADNTARFRQEVQVTSGASPLATLVWKSSVDTGTASFTDRFKIDSSGVVSIPGSLVLGSASGALSASSGTVSVGTLSVSNGGTGATSFTTSKILTSNSSSTTGAITTATAMDYSASGQHLTISAQGATVTPLRVIGTTSQSANLFEVYSTSATALLTVGTTSMNLQPYGTSAGNTYGIKFFELAANGSNSVTLKAPDSITSDYSVTVQPNSKSVTILSPTSSDRITMFYTDTAIKFTKVVSVIRGTSATSSWQLYYGTDRTSGTAVFSTTQSTTSTTTGNVTTTFANANAAANSFIWLEMSTQTSVTEVHITVFYD